MSEYKELPVCWDNGYHLVKIDRPHKAFLASLKNSLIYPHNPSQGPNFFFLYLCWWRQLSQHPTVFPFQATSPWASLPFLFTLVTYFFTTLPWKSYEKNLPDWRAKSWYCAFFPPFWERDPLIGNKYLLIPKEWATQGQNYHNLRT